VVSAAADTGLPGALPRLLDRGAGLLADAAESFARSFAQWIAERAGVEDGLAEVERRARGAGRQWAREDFAPVAAELDRVLAPLAAAA
jgi:hypothetical protein